MDYKNKGILITGGNRGIGKGIVKAFIKAGANVCFSYCSGENEAKALVDYEIPLGQKIHALKADFQDLSSVDQLFSAAKEKLGQVDVLINCAGGYDTTPFIDLDINVFQEVLQIGVLATARLSQLLARDWINQKANGAIVNISSISGLRPHTNRTAHASAKACLNMLTKSMALELGPYGIRVNAICPGGTPYEDGSGVDPKMLEKIPLKRFGKQQDHAHAALYLASQEAAWVTGHIMVVDGGQGLSF